MKKSIKIITIATLSLLNCVIPIHGSTTFMENALVNKSEQVFHYSVSIGKLKVGTGEIKRSNYNSSESHIKMELLTKGRFTVFSFSQKMESIYDTENGSSLSFFRETIKNGKSKRESVEFSSLDKTWKNIETSEITPLETSTPLDDLSVLYKLQSMELDIGKTYVINDYYKPHRVPVTVKVLQVDTITVPAGTFPVLKIGVTVNGSKYFGEEGRVEAYVTDDEAHNIIKLCARLPIFGYGEAVLVK